MLEIGAGTPLVNIPKNINLTDALKDEGGIASCTSYFGKETAKHQRTLPSDRTEWYGMEETQYL